MRDKQLKFTTGFMYMCTNYGVLNSSYNIKIKIKTTVIRSAFSARSSSVKMAAL